MNNNFPNRETVEKLRKEYPKGTVVILEKMIDVQAPEIGTAWEVLSVDDIGTVHIAWLSGGTLGSANGEDKIHKAGAHETALYKIAKASKRQKADPDGVHFCPRCGEEMSAGIYRHAISRRTDVVVCDLCGVKESIEDAVAAGFGYTVTIPETCATGHCEHQEEIVPTGEKLWRGWTPSDLHPANILTISIKEDNGAGAAPTGHKMMPFVFYVQQDSMAYRKL